SNDKHRFSVELLGYVCGRCLGGMDIAGLNFLQTRLQRYRDDLAREGDADDFARLTTTLLALLGADNYLGLRAAQYARTRATILATTQFINEINKSYKFV